MIDKLNYTLVINDFFRDKDLQSEDLKKLHTNYKNELAELGKNGGCSRCKKNTLRRKYKKLILENLKSHNK